MLLVLGDSVEFVALWYGAQKIGAVTAEAYTFLQPKDYAYYLDYTRRCRRRRPDDAGACVTAARDGRWLRAHPCRGEDFERARGGGFGRARPGSDDQGRRARSGSSRPGSTGLPKAAVQPQHSPVLSLRVVREGGPRHPRGRRRPPRPEALLRLRPDLTALFPFGVGAAGIVFPGADDAGADLRARRRAPPDDPCQRADDDGPDGRRSRPAGTRTSV